MVRPLCCDKLGMRKGAWNEEDDEQMLAFVTKQPTGKGIRRCGKSCRIRKTNVSRNDHVRHESFTPQEEELIIKLHSAIGSRKAKAIGDPLDLSSSTCVTSYNLVLSSLNNAFKSNTMGFHIFSHYDINSCWLFPRWPIIAQQLPGRTDNDVKNYWNTKLKKKLSAMGIDPVTHRPFSQMLADYGNISGLTRSQTRIASLNRDNNNKINNTFFVSNQEIQHIQQIPETFFPNFNNSVKTEPPEAAIIKTDSLDLLKQLQAITHVKDPSTNPDISLTQFHVSLASSSSSSSSTCSATLNDHQTTTPQQQQQAFNWRDFLIENSQDDESFDAIGGIEVVKGNNGNDNNNNNNSNSPLMNNGVDEGCDGSFVEAMLDGENDMLLDFPGLLGEPVYY
ncbi:hypothetical protein OSB04_004155 [Centaurea solstitialis]|uniref:Uncharacterized protein n=1 Tax=Centaurea solstitialis TaxID=347529 RepID=A0AA38WVH9_9ASTR|nr:hypothetical protein OSB04_004155 [Centaurea solstitialis]